MLRSRKKLVKYGGLIEEELGPRGAGLNKLVIYPVRILHSVD